MKTKNTSEQAARKARFFELCKIVSPAARGRAAKVSGMTGLKEQTVRAYLMIHSERYPSAVAMRVLENAVAAMSTSAR